MSLTTCIVLDAETKQKLARLARATDRSQSATIRDLLRQAVIDTDADVRRQADRAEVGHATAS